MPIEFTVDHDHTVIDDEGQQQLIGNVSFTVQTRPGDFQVRIPGGSPPRTIKLPRRTAYLGIDGHLYKDSSSGEPFRLPANDPVYNLDHITYRADFDLTDIEGTRVPVRHCFFPAPATDTTLYLTKVMVDPEQIVMEVRTKGYIEDILDAGGVGELLMAAETAAEARDAIDASQLDANGAVVANYAKITGGQSATTGLRFVGAVATEGWPTTGTWLYNDVVQDKYGAFYRCVTGGTPGVWSNMSAGFMDQVGNEFQPYASYIVGGPVTLSSTPTTLPVADASRFPNASPAGAKEIVIGSGVPGPDENRVLATYTGVSGNNLTGVVTQSGNPEDAPDGEPVWYAKSGLRSSYMRIPNGIIARSGVDDLPHDLVLCAAYDDSGRVNRADYDIILTREAGSYGVLHIALPVRFPKDTPFYDGSGSLLMKFAGSVESDSNATTPDPLPNGTIEVYGTLVGAQGSNKSLIIRNSGEANSRIRFQSSNGTQKFSIDENGPEIPNLTELRFLRVADASYGAMFISGGNRMTIRNASAAGFALVNNANTIELLKADDLGNVTLARSLIETANTQTGTTYTLALTDGGKTVELNNASAVTLTVPPNSTAAFPTGSLVRLCQYGAGQVTVSPGAGVTIRSLGGATKITGQYGTARLRKRATDEWVLEGNITT